MYINTISYNNNIFYYYFLQSFRWNWIKHNKWVVWKSRIGLARICFWVGPCQPITPWCYTVQSFWVGHCLSVIPSTEFMVGPCHSITPWGYCAEFLGGSPQWCYYLALVLQGKIQVLGLGLGRNTSSLWSWSWWWSLAMRPSNACISRCIVTDARDSNSQCQHAN